MFTLSAFADEIAADPIEQMTVLRAVGVRHLEFRSAWGTNVLALDDARISQFKALLDEHGFAVSAIGSPIGKIRIDEPFEPHLDKFERAIDLARYFRTANVRIFSYYPPEGQTWESAPAALRDEVFRRLEIKAKRAQQVRVRLVHENEHGIFGESPENCAAIFQAVPSPALKAAFDPANWEFCGHDPLKGWELMRPHTVHFHIKDWVRGEPHGRMPGTGNGKIAEVMADAVKDGYVGFATLEPHLQSGGTMGGFTGPELFQQAVVAYRRILDGVGGKVVTEQFPQG